MNYPLFFVSVFACFWAVFALSLNTPPSTKINSVNKYLVPNYFSEIIKNETPVYYSIKGSNEIHHSKTNISLMDKKNDDFSIDSVIRKTITNVNPKVKEKLVLDLGYIDYSSCVDSVSITNKYGAKDIINKNSAKFNECFTQVLKATPIRNKEALAINSNLVINKYKNSDPKMKALISQIKEKKVLNTYDAIELYVLAYNAKEKALTNSIINNL